MATQIKRLIQNGQEFVPITLAEAVVVNQGAYGSTDKITTLDNALRTILGNESSLNSTVETINQTLATKQDKLTFSNQFTVTEDNGTITVALAETFKLFEYVTSLPTENISSNKIYLLPYEGGTAGNILKEFVYVNGNWEEFGQIQVPEEIDLSGYITRTEYTSKINELEATIATHTSSLETINNNIITTSNVTTSTGATVSVNYDIPKTLYDAVTSNGEEDHITG